LAPCPHCGHIQPEMFASCQSPPSVRLWSNVGTFLSFIAALALFYAVITTGLNSGPFRTEDSLVAPWAAFGILAVLAAGSFFISWWLRKRWDPNSQSQAKRLQLGKQL